MIVHRRIMVASLVVALVALPFSVKICHAAVIVFILNWSCEGSWRDKFIKVRQSIILQLVILFFALQVAGLAFSDSLLTGWFSVEKKLFLVLIPVALATSSVKLQQPHLRIIFLAFIASCVVGTFFCIFGAWQEVVAPTATNPSLSALPTALDQGWLVFSYVGLAQGIGIHPTYLSFYLAVSLLLVLENLASVGNAYLRGVGVLLIIYLAVIIVLLSSRIILVGMSLIFVFILIRSITQRRRSPGVIAFSVLAIFVFMVLVNPVTRYRSIDELNATTFHIQANTQYTTAAQIRVSLWWIAANTIRESNPLTGLGTGDVLKAMSDTGEMYGITNVINSSDPHNQYLYTWLANGTPGILVLLFCLFLPAWWAWTRGDLMTCAFVLLFCLMSTTESALERQKGIVCYALISGLLFFHKQSFQNYSVGFKSFLRVGEQRL